jgi:hypothetical protein
VLPGEATPPAEALAPPRASVEVLEVAPAAGEPRELVAQWRRATRPPRSELPHRDEAGVFIWQHVRGAWRLAFRYRATRWEPYIGAEVADVTGDGHRDVLVGRVTGGTGNCGTRSVFASVRGQVQQVFRRAFCEGSMDSVRGRLVLRLPVGPCPDARGSAHCFGGMATTTLRFDGERFVPVSRTVACVEPRLDARRNCS